MQYTNSGKSIYSLNQRTYNYSLDMNYTILYILQINTSTLKKNNKNEITSEDIFLLQT